MQGIWKGVKDEQAEKIGDDQLAEGLEIHSLLAVGAS